MKRTDHTIWNYIFNDGKPRRPRRKLNDLARELRGPPQNRFGGYQTQKMRPIRGSKLGTANEGRSLSAEERRHAEEELRAKGIIT